MDTRKGEKLHAPFSLKQSITICSRFVMILEDCSCCELHETPLSWKVNFCTLSVVAYSSFICTAVILSSINMIAVHILLWLCEVKPIVEDRDLLCVYVHACLSWPVTVVKIFLACWTNCLFYFFKRLVPFSLNFQGFTFKTVTFEHCQNNESSCLCIKQHELLHETEQGL